MRIVLTVLVFAIALGHDSTVHAQSTDRPNVVLIITDDVGYGDFGSYGAPDVKTPNIDSLAKNGTRLTDFYAAPSCSTHLGSRLKYWTRRRWRSSQWACCWAWPAAAPNLHGYW